MNKKILVALLTLSSLSAVGGDLTNKYVELIANKKVAAFQSPYGTPQIFEETIDTAGYSEIRMFIHVFAEEFKKSPITNKTKIEATLFHEVRGGSWDYSKKEIRSEVTSYIHGWFTEKVIGDKTRIVAFARNLPEGPYSVTVTYYLA